MAIITGGGQGLGREYALHFAAEGAKVLVNDLGGTHDGSGSDIGIAATVVDEIKAMGGDAVANTDSVESFHSAEALVSEAIESFGALHVIVNNAGIIRDRMLVSMTEDEFDQVIGVHMKGTFNLSHHAAAYWRDQAKAGVVVDRAIVNTTSAAGLHGNLGQTNYAAAKAGIAAMTIVNSMELGRYHVRSNCIAPLARTRMTRATPGISETMEKAFFDPAHVSPLVAYLATETCPFNGQVFSIFGDRVGIYQGWSIHEEIRVAQGGVTEFGRSMEALPRAVKVNSQVHALREETARPSLGDEA